MGQGQARSKKLFPETIMDKICETNYFSYEEAQYQKTLISIFQQFSSSIKKILI